MNLEKLKKLQKEVRIGGKGTPRRKKKVLHSTPATDDKKLQSSLKKLSVNTIPGIEEVNIIKNDGGVIHFNNPKTQASLATNTFAITGHGENKQISDMLPGILSQLGPDGLLQLKKIANDIVANKSLGAGADDDDVPELVENFDEVAIKDKPAASSSSTSQVTENAVDWGVYVVWREVWAVSFEKSDGKRFSFVIIFQNV